MAPRKTNFFHFSAAQVADGEGGREGERQEGVGRADDTFEMWFTDTAQITCHGTGVRIEICRLSGVLKCA